MPSPMFIEWTVGGDRADAGEKRTVPLSRIKDIQKRAEGAFVILYDEENDDESYYIQEPYEKIVVRLQLKGLVIRPKNADSLV